MYLCLRRAQLPMCDATHIERRTPNRALPTGESAGPSTAQDRALCARVSVRPSAPDLL